MLKIRSDVALALILLIVVCAPFALQQHNNLNVRNLVDESRSFLKGMRTIMVEEYLADGTVREICCGSILEHDSNCDGTISFSERMTACRMLRERAKVCDMYVNFLDRAVDVCDLFFWTRTVSLQNANHGFVQDTRKKS